MFFISKKLFLPGAGFLQTIDLIYNAIQTIIAKANELKALVDALTMAAGDLVNNNLGGATANVVDALNDITGIAISFIARYAGMTKITNKINEIIEKISGKIRKVYEDIKAFITKKIEGLVGKVKALFHKWAPIIFHVGEGKHKEEHRIYLEEVGGKPEVFVRSTPKTIPEKLREWKGQKQPKTPSGKSTASDLMVEAMNLYERIKVEATRPKKKDENDKPTSKTAALTQPEKKLAIVMKKLFTLYQEKGDDMRPILKEKTVIKHESKKSMALVTLNKEGKKSTTSTATGWDYAIKLNKTYDQPGQKKSADGKKGPWVRGHKVSERLGGDGTKKNNIFIIRRSANTEMTNRAEDPAHQLLQKMITWEAAGKKGDEYEQKLNKVLYYEVRYTMHPKAGFGHQITISWGLQDFTGDPSIEKNRIDLKTALVIESKAPPENVTEPEEKILSINQTEWNQLYKRADNKGYGYEKIPSGFWRELASIRKKHNIAFTEKDIEYKIIQYFNFDKLSEDKVEKAIPELIKLLKDPKTKITY